MAANEQLARERGGRGEEDGDVDDEASFFELELALTGHPSAVIADGEEEKDNKVDVKGKMFDFTVDGEKSIMTAVQAGGHGGHVTRQLAPEQLGPAARLRALVPKLRKPTVAWQRPAGGGGAPAAPVENRCLDKAGAQTAGQLGVGAVAAGERRTTKEAALRLYLGKMVTLVRRRGGRDGTDSPLPPSHPQATPAVRSGRSSRDEACDAAPATGLRLAGKALGMSRSAVTAMPPPQKRGDDSLLQAQDGIASAIAHCKLSLEASRGFESPKIFRA